ncbi:MAG: AAA family ATPase, partial [Clostridium sp.]|nr:AAA family ATPase [Clostridium sp.]
MIGFHNLRERFLKAIQNNTLSHAHLVVGPNGIGKSRLVESLSRELLGFGDRNSVDIVRIRPEKTIITVKQIREVVLEASLRPYEGLKKVIIFYEANKMGQEAQNALLKTIEEPLEGVYFFLLTENEMSMTDTILSRCHLHKLHPLGDEEMKEYIERFMVFFNEEEESRYERELAQKESLKTKGQVEEKKILHLTQEQILGVISVSRGIPERAEEIMKNQLIDENLQLIYR